MKTQKLLICSLYVLAALGQPHTWAATPLVNHGDAWRYHKGTNAPQADWKTAGDAALDGTWATGIGGFGYANNPGVTTETNNCGTILGDMYNRYPTLYVRREFTRASPPAANEHLYLRVDWDDGFIVWLNGTYLTNRNSPGAPAEPANTASASADHESSLGNSSPKAAETYDLGFATNWLTTGTSTLAMIGLNGGSGSSDFILVADLYLEAVAEPPPVTNGVGGAITTDATWYATNRIYTVTNQITVASNATLTIEPGVTVRLRRNCGITVNGRLLADGTTNQPIAFTRHPGDLNWERIQFIQAADSLFRNCVFEYANSAGDHKNEYYATNCAYPMNVAPRNYFEAVVALACHLDFEGCVFTNLFTSDGTLREGDAIGIFSDDLVYRGPASANIRGCQFRYIGQGVNTRYAYVLVENCYFVGKTGDNDDVEMYGESSLYGLPSPVVRGNLFDIPAYDDRIHPTRCSALISDNLILGSTDHAIVLRDTCCPIVVNNVMFNCPAGGISIQNGCDALIANNTFYGINSAIKLFDHQSRITYPYCLSAMSGRATVINCIVWNGNNAIDVSGSAGAAFTEFRVNVSYSDLQGGTGSLYTGSNTKYKVEWGPGITNTDPLFVSAAGRNARLNANSPCVDAGSTNLGIYVTTNTYFVGTNRITYAVTNDLSLFVTHDADGLARPLDGNGDGVARFDLGAYEVLLPSADSNGDSIPDGWCQRYGFSPVAPGVASEDADSDGVNNSQEYVADTDPTNALAFFHIEAISTGSPVAVSFLTSSNRHYTLLGTTDLASGSNLWTNVSESDIPGSGGVMTLTETNAAPARFYRVGVQVP